MKFHQCRQRQNEDGNVGHDLRKIRPAPKRVHVDAMSTWVELWFPKKADRRANQTLNDRRRDHGADLHGYQGVSRIAIGGHNEDTQKHEQDSDFGERDGKGLRYRERELEFQVYHQCRRVRANIP